MNKFAWLGPIIFIAISVLAMTSFTWRQSVTPFTVHTQNLHDSLWHIALMEQINQELPPMNPLVSGERLKGYHYINDVLMVLIHRVTGISFATLYLQIMPFVVTGLFAATTLWLCKKLFSSSYIAYASASVITLGSGLAFYAPWFFPNARVEQSVFWLDQTVHLALNQQLVLSLAMLNVMLIILKFHLQKYWWVAGLLLGLMSGIKIYGWIVLGGAIGLLSIVTLVKHREWRWFGVATIGAIVGLLFVMLTGSERNIGFPFLWSPGWFWQKMFESSDHLNWPTWELRRQVFAINTNIPRLTLLWLQAAILFFAGNFSLKLIGLATPLILLKKKLTLETTWWWLLATIALISLVIPSVALQKGVVWNTIQFMHYAQIPLAVLTIHVLQSVIPRKKVVAAVLTGLILVMLPTTMQGMYLNTSSTNYKTIDTQLITDIAQLRNNYQDKELLLSTELTENAIVPAFSGRAVYWADPIMDSVLGTDYLNRQNHQLGLTSGEQACQPNQVVLSEQDNRLIVATCPVPKAKN